MIDLNRIKKNEKLIKIGIFGSIFLFVSLVISLVFICLNVNDDNANVLRIIAIVISLVVGFVIIFFLTEFIYSRNIENKFLKVLRDAEVKKYNSEVKEIGKILTTKKYRKSLLIEIENQKDKVVLNYDLTYSKCNLEKGKRYIFETRNNYIISYEEIKDE